MRSRSRSPYKKEYKSRGRGRRSRERSYSSSSERRSSIERASKYDDRRKHRDKSPISKYRGESKRDASRERIYKKNDRSRSRSPKKTTNKRPNEPPRQNPKKWDHDFYCEDPPSPDKTQSYRRKNEEKDMKKSQGADDLVSFMDTRRYNRELIGASGVEMLWGKSPARPIGESDDIDSGSGDSKKPSKKSSKKKKDKKSKKHKHKSKK